MRLGFAVEAIDPVRVHGAAILSQRQLMSPYVWRARDGGLHMLMRAVPDPASGSLITGRIWHGLGDASGLDFQMDEAPLLTPGPNPDEMLGCEDPTVVPTDEACIVYYTGLDRNGDAQMLYAAGADIATIKKKGVVFKSRKTRRHTKEATVNYTKDGAWRLFYEFSREQRSVVGLALGQGPAGPWQERAEPFHARPELWDCHHLSTGPLLMEANQLPVMFYNGATETAQWRIGWIAFDHDLQSVVQRCDAPLIAPPPRERGARDIAFAASLVRTADEIWLYYSVDDRTLYRASIARA